LAKNTDTMCIQKVLQGAVNTGMDLDSPRVLYISVDLVPWDSLVVGLPQ